jgi:protein-S-isoprenylcysteine O-methyltransferase Ste14
MINGRVLPENTFLLIAEILLCIGGLWCALLLNKNFSVLPAPVESAKLIKSGPYKYVRHPIYTVVILLALIWISEKFSVVNLIVFISLILIFIVKINYEENFLKKKFPDYENYISESKKLIPFIY